MILRLGGQLHAPVFAPKEPYPPVRAVVTNPSGVWVLPWSLHQIRHVFNITPEKKKK